MKARPMTKEAFSKWGKFIAKEDVTGQTQNPSFNHVPDIAVFDITGPVSASILQPKKTPLILKYMEMHKQTSEICVALENDCIIVVAKNKEDKPDMETTEAFLLQQGDTVVYPAGIWHWVPFTTGADSSKQLIIYRNHTGKNDFFMSELSKKVELER